MNEPVMDPITEPKMEYGDELFIYAMALREQVDNDKEQDEQDSRQNEG